MDLGYIATSFFYQDWNADNQQTWVTTPAVHQGDMVYVDVQYTGSNSSTYYYLNYTRNYYNSVSENTPNVDLTSAEAINEDLKENWSSVNFGSLEFFSPGAYGTWGSGNHIQKLLSDSVTLSEFTAYMDKSKANKVASPGSIDGSGDFTDYATAANDVCEPTG